MTDKPPSAPNKVLALYAGLMGFYFLVVVYGVYRSLSARGSIMAALADNGMQLAIFGACLALLAASFAGQRKK